MTLDYKKLGLKCGIEIHQQLDTHKLFCSCPSTLRDDKPDFTVERKMRAVAGELGDVDPAAIQEFLRDRTLVYEFYQDTNCLVELDEEPPHEVNGDALRTVAKIAMLLNAKVVDELQVMRKTVIDGSNTSGFQRTILVATDGYVETTQGKVGIPFICLEEDAARKIREDGNRIHYRLDRLGIPLVEIGTAPDIISPEHARETAEKLGKILRVTKVKRGLGTIRQDLNVSIAEGERVEMKGVQDLRLISRLVENEVRRQVGLVEIKKELVKRGRAPFDRDFKVVKTKSGEATKASSSPRDYAQTQRGRIEKGLFVDITNLFLDDNRDWIKKRIASGDKVWGMRLRGFAGLLGKELMPDHRFGTELSHVVKASTGLKGILHSDEEANQKISKKIADKLGCDPQDAWVVIIGVKSVASTGFTVIYRRCNAAFLGVPNETRRALADGKSEYMRPLPGSARMYPETDEMPIKLNWTELKKELPELPEDTLKRLISIGLSKEIAGQMVNTQKSELFLALVKRFPRAKASVIATLVVMTPKEVKKRYDIDVSLDEQQYVEILGELEKGAISKDVIPEVVFGLAKHPNKKAEDIIKEKGLALVTPKELEKIIDTIIKQGGGEESTNLLVGKVMAKVGGRADPKVVRDMLIKKEK